MENILTLLSVLLAAESILIIGVMVYFMRPKSRAGDVSYDNTLAQVQSIFDAKIDEIATRYAEEMAALKYFEQIDGVEINIPNISSEATKRVLALNIKKAETAIVICEESLNYIRARIAHYQKQVSDGYSIFASDISRLKEQENFAMKHLSEAQTRFNILVKTGQNSVSQPTLIK